MTICPIHLFFKSKDVLITEFEVADLRLHRRGTENVDMERGSKCGRRSKHALKKGPNLAVTSLFHNTKRFAPEGRTEV